MHRIASGPNVRVRVRLELGLGRFRVRARVRVSGYLKWDVCTRVLFIGPMHPMHPMH